MKMKSEISVNYKYTTINSYNNKRHSHGDRYEIMLVHSGKGSFLVRDHIFPLVPNGVYFVNGLETHCSVPDTSEEYCRSLVIINSDLLNSFTEASDCGFLIDNLFGDHGGICINPDEKCIKLIESEIKNVEKYMRENTALTKVKVLMSVVNILIAANANRNALPDPTKMHKNKAIAGILNFINSNLTQDLSLELICEKVHLSRYYLCHTFKKYVGMSVFEYILALRLAKAKYYLTYSDNSVSQIAELTGFSSFSYFGRIFKKYENCSPREYRNMSKKRG